MSGDEPDLVADGERPVGLAELEIAVLVGGGGVFDVAQIGEGRHSRIDGQSLLAGIDGGTIARRLAHHRRIDEEAVLEIADWSAVLVEVARIMRIHEDVGADLKLVIDAARALERVGPGSRSVDIAAVMAIAAHHSPPSTPLLSRPPACPPPP